MKTNVLMWRMLMNTREIKIKRMLMKFDDKLYNLIEEHFKIDMDYNYSEGTYHSFRNDVIRLFAELFGEELYKQVRKEDAGEN